MRKVIAIAGALVLLLAAAGTSQAVLLSDLLNGGSITAGDKLFDNWSYSYYSTDPARAFNPNSIDVVALNNGGLVPGPGLEYVVSNDELTVAGDGLYAYIDLMLSFTVSVLDPALMLKDHSLQLTSGYLNHPIGQDLGMYVRETIGTSAIEADFSMLDGSLSANTIDSGAFAAQSSAVVTTNILVWSVDIADTANLTGFAQRFSQGPASVPEPGMLSLLAFGGIALLRFKRS
jgi:hypothetical protein